MKAAGLAHAARHGPVVVINCYQDRCDAIVISCEANLTHIPLPNFTGEKAQGAYSKLSRSIRSKRLRERGVKIRLESGQKDNFRSVLADLWNEVVKPILDVLGYTSGTLTGDLPHITWCPTGALSFLPLHAAGDYDQPRSKIFDYVISSYTPTLTALLATQPISLSSDSRLLAIGMESTPGHNPLPGTIRELECVKGHAQNMIEYSQLVNNQATKTSVLDGMEQQDLVHLACHAHQNVRDPTKSGFFMHDGTLDLAAIDQRSFKNKGPLASGMLIAGYSSVIATIWSVMDNDAPFVADKVYGQLMKVRKLGNGEAGRALHYAVAALREEVGEMEFGRWVPYIHIGS
ncbi:hypothetical protein OPQ81_002550 [Rhizoctonia solani]|nr:hypothetical protein OPQ81_002550 [Rhizoctonia solani]